MASDAFPQLEQFFGGYLHQDWATEFGQPEAALRAYLASAGPSERSELRAELNRLLERRTEAALGEACLELGCAYRPRGAWRSWLGALERRLRRG